MFESILRVRDPNGVVFEECRFLFLEDPPAGKRFPFRGHEIVVTGYVQAWLNRGIVLAETTSG